MTAEWHSLKQVMRASTCYGLTGVSQRHCLGSAEQNLKAYGCPSRLYRRYVVYSIRQRLSTAVEQRVDTGKNLGKKSVIQCMGPMGCKLSSIFSLHNAMEHATLGQHTDTMVCKQRAPMLRALTQG